MPPPAAVAPPDEGRRPDGGYQPTAVPEPAALPEHTAVQLPAAVPEPAAAQVPGDAAGYPPPAQPTAQPAPEMTQIVAQGVALPNLRAPVDATLHAEQQRLVAICERELATSPPPARAARLHFELGRIAATATKAIEHYRAALALNADHLPSLRAARLLELERRDVDSVVSLLNAEIRLADDARARARLYHEMGRVLEDLRGDVDGARACYQRATEHDPNTATYFEALEQCQLAAGQWQAVAAARQGSAQAIRTDNRHRAALVAQRASLLETRLADAATATELYQQALEMDPDAPGAMEALCRLLAVQQRWRDLITVLERRAAQTTDAAVRTQVLFTIAQIHGERLGHRESAVAALTRAMQSSPRDRLVLETLARLYEQAGEQQSLASTLAHMVDIITEPSERLALMVRIGCLYEKDLRDDGQARPWYEAALGIDVTYVPAVNALDGLYERAQAWEPLIVMHFATAQAAGDSLRRAAALTRIAEIFELRLHQPEEAINHHAHALALDPGSEASFKALTRLLAQRGRHRELIELYERGIDRARDADLVIAYLFKIGSLWEDALAEPNQAAHAYKRILALDGRNLGALHALQRASERAGRHPQLAEALELEAELEADPARRVALLQRAADVFANLIGDRDAAVIRYRRVLSLDEDHAPALSALGRVYHQLGRHQDLRDILERELAITPSGPQVVALLHRLGELCASEIGDDEAAIGYYRRAVATDPRHGPSLRALTHQLERRGDWAGMVALLQAQLVATTAPDERAATACRLAEVLEIHLRQPERAVEAYLMALAAAGGHRPALAGLSRVRAALGAWQQQAPELVADSSRVQDRSIAVDLLLRAAEIESDLLGRSQHAVAALESVRSIDRYNLGALLALLPLYRRAANWSAVAEVYSTLAGVLGDPMGRVAALEELARMQQLRGAGDEAAQRRTYNAILSIDPRHGGALVELERMALRQGDGALLADVDARFARGAGPAPVVGVHAVRLGELVETDNPAAALASYRAALEQDHDDIAAIRGLARAAERLGDAATVVEACRRLAAWTRDGALAADSLVRSAQVCLDRLGDVAAATHDAEAALERWPDHELAARMVSDLLREAGQVDRLVTLLGQAAASARRPARVASLWRAVARLYADDKGDLGAGLAALARLRAEQPDEVATLRLLGDLHVRNQQWKEAEQALLRAMALEPAAEQQLPIRLSLGRIYAKHLDNADAALINLEAAVALDARQREALLLLLDLYEAARDHDAARRTVERLLHITEDPPERGWALLELGRIELVSGNKGRAAAALRDAVAIQGPAGEAAAAYKKLLGDEHPWDRYVEALQEHIRRVHAGELQSAQLRDVYVSVARIQHEVLLQIDPSIETLRAGIGALGEDPVIHHELAERLATSGRLDAAGIEYRRILAREPSDARAWRGLARALHESGHKLEAGVALAPLVILGEASEIEAGMSRQRRLDPGWGQPGSLEAGVLAKISAADPWEESRLVGLFSALGEALEKAYPTDFDSYGVGARDSLRSDHPLRQLGDRLAKIFAVEEFELYLHEGTSFSVAIELTQPPSLMISRSIAELPEAQQVFVLARSFALVARGGHAVVTLGRRESERLLRAALLSAAPNDRSDDDIATLSKRLLKVLSRRNRKLLETAAAQCLSEPPADLERWGATLEPCAARAAALLTNDLPAVVSALRQSGAVPANLEGVAMVHGSPLLSNLLRFWATDVAFEVRRSAGLL